MLINSNLKYAGAVYLFIYDFEEKEVIFQYNQDLLPLIDSFDLPQLSDRANLCENNMVYRRKDISIKMNARVNQKTGDCETSFDWSIKGQFNFKGTHSKKFGVDENYSDIRAIDKEKKYFYFNQKEYLNKCSFSIDIKKDLMKPPADIEDLVQNSKTNSASSIYSQDVYNELEGSTVRIGTPDMTSRDDCYGHYDYGRGVFLYKTNWFWTWGQGTTTITNKQNETQEVKVAVNFGGAIAHVDHIKSSEDYFKINNRVIRLHPVEMVFDKLNHMNGFIFRTAEEFKERETQTVDLVFTSHKELVKESNFVILKVGYSRGLIERANCIILWDISMEPLSMMKGTPFKLKILRQRLNWLK